MEIPEHFVGPIRQASAVMKGIKVGLDMLRRQQNNKPESIRCHRTKNFLFEVVFFCCARGSSIGSLFLSKKL